MSITGGVVTFEQSRKLAEYENRKASITFNVNEPENENASAAVIAALALAQHHVFVALGLTPPAPTVAAKEPTSIDPPAKPAGTRAKRPPPVVVDTSNKASAEDAIVVEDPKAQAGATSAGGTAASVSDATVVEDPTQQPAATTAGSATPSDPAAVEEWAAEAPAVTDTALLAAISRKNAELQLALGPAAPPKIRALIGEFVTAPKGARDIPADVRTKFLEKLEALKA